MGGAVGDGVGDPGVAPTLLLVSLAPGPEPGFGAPPPWPGPSGGTSARGVSAEQAKSANDASNASKDGSADERGIDPPGGRGSCTLQHKCLTPVSPNTMRSRRGVTGSAKKGDAGGTRPRPPPHRWIASSSCAPWLHRAQWLQRAWICPRPAARYFFAAGFAGALAGAGLSALSVAGFTLTNFRVIRSLSPMATYFARSCSFSRSVGGSVQTPSG